MTQDRDRPLTLSQFVPYRMVNLATEISNGCSRVYREQFDISIPEWRVLARLAEQDNLNSKEVGKATFMDKSKVSRAIKLLEEKNLLARSKDAEDNRAAKLSLTKQGFDMYLNIANEALAWERDMLSALTQKESELLNKIMNKLDAKLTNMDED